MRVPEQSAIKELRLKQEDTEFHINTDATTWALALPNYRSSYECEYVKLPITAFSNQGWGFEQLPDRDAFADAFLWHGMDDFDGSRPGRN
jgi:Glycosyl-hydrolase 97 N-terminal